MTTIKTHVVLLHVVHYKYHTVTQYTYIVNTTLLHSIHTLDWMTDVFLSALLFLTDLEDGKLFGHFPNWIYY